MTSFLRLALPAFLLATVALPAGAQDHKNTTLLTFEEAIAAGLEFSPGLSAASSREGAAVAARDQATAWPNPEVSIEAENIFGDGPYEGTDAAEITYGVSQLIEMPGKRGGRVSIADADRRKAAYQHGGSRLDLIRDIKVSYASSVSAEQRLHILEEERKLSAEVLESVAAKVEAGKEPPIQRNKAQIELAASRVAFERAQRDYRAQISALSILMGNRAKDFTLAPDSLPAVEAPQSLDYYLERLSSAPEIRDLDADIERAQSNLSLEKSSAMPDPTLSFGMRDDRDSGDRALVAGVSFPFPVFNLNRAGIQRAGHELNAAKMDQRGKIMSAEAELERVHAEFANAFSEVVTIKESMLPGAEEAFSFARTGYDAGKFNYLDVLDAQRTLFDVRKQLNDATLSYYTQRALIERMSSPDETQTASRKKEK